MKTLKRQRIYINQELVDNTTKDCKAALMPLQDIINKAKSLAMDVSDENLQALISQPEKFVDDQRFKQTEQSEGFKEQSLKGMKLLKYMEVYTPEFPDATDFIIKVKAFAKLVAV